MSKRTSDADSGGRGPTKRRNLITDILSSSQKTNASAHTAKKKLATMSSSSSLSNQVGSKINTSDSSAPDRAIAEFMETLRQTIEQRGFGSEVEIELRFGLICSQLQKNVRYRSTTPGEDAAVVLTDVKMRELGAEFIPGVNVEQFKHYMKSATRLAESDRYAKQLEKQVSYTFPGSRRVLQTIDPHTNEKIDEPVLQKKERMGIMNVFLPNCPYDIRVAVACEFPTQSMGAHGLEEMHNPESERYKDRTSIVGERIQLDLTKVEEKIQNHQTFEVEIELKNSAAQTWLRAPELEGFKVAMELSAELWNAVRMFMPNSGQAFKRTWHSIAPQEEALRSAYIDIFGSQWKARDKFPGTMPVGFSRWHLAQIKRRKYWISEKTDGVRYFLVVAGGTVALIDRTNAPFTTAGLDFLTSVLPDGTVLDGEFVLHQKQQKYVFMIFDVLSYDSTNYISRPFEERLQVLNQLFAEEGPYATALLRGHVQSHAVLSLLKKRWIPATHITEVFRHITKVKLRDGKSIARVYRDDKREHFTDGIIFCPNTRYECASHGEYLKWKWSDLITIDFITTLTSAPHQTPVVQLACEGPHNAKIPLDRLIQLDPKDLGTIAQILSQQKQASSIMEYGFDIESGLWKYKLNRPDKDRANYITTVLGSLMNMAESISEEELQYRMTAEQDDWNEQSKQMRRRILHQQLHQK